MLLLSAAALVLGLLGARTAHAVSSCDPSVATTTFTGGAGTSSWHTGANWSAGATPGAADHVCIPAGSTVSHTTGTTVISSMEVAGQLTVSGGTLQLSGPQQSDVPGTLNLAGATLGGTGALSVPAGGLFDSPGRGTSGTRAGPSSAGAASRSSPAASSTTPEPSR